jgi:Family of unknown function (DUF6492)
MSGVHLVIFCAGSYQKYFLDHCIYCVEQNVRDKILSRTIVTNVPCKRPNFDTVIDSEIWKMIDPEFKHKKLLYNRWWRQQILKFSIGKIKSGDVLVVDADLFFLQPVTLVQDQKYNIYTALEHDPVYFRTLNYLLGINKQITQSFISDFSVFNTDLLELLKQDIENRHNLNWIEVLENCLAKSRVFSEFETYGNYMVAKYPEKINQIISPLQYQMYLGVDADGLLVSNEDFLQTLRSQTNNYYQCVQQRKVSSFTRIAQR